MTLLRRSFAVSGQFPGTSIRDQSQRSQFSTWTAPRWFPLVILPSGEKPRVTSEKRVLRGCQPHRTLNCVGPDKYRIASDGLRNRGAPIGASRSTRLPSPQPSSSSATGNGDDQHFFFRKLQAMGQFPEEDGRISFPRIASHPNYLMGGNETFGNLPP